VIVIPGSPDAAKPMTGRKVAEILQRLGRARQQFLDFDGDAVAADDHGALRHRHVIGENANLVLLGGIEFDDGAAAKPKNLVDRHRGSTQHHGDIDRDIIKGRQGASRGFIDVYRMFHHAMVTGSLTRAGKSRFSLKDIGLG
jgi:hypothetical protein